MTTFIACLIVGILTVGVAVVWYELDRIANSLEK